MLFVLIWFLNLYKIMMFSVLVNPIFDVVIPDSF